MARWNIRDTEEAEEVSEGRQRYLTHKEDMGEVLVYKASVRRNRGRPWVLRNDVYSS